MSELSESVPSVGVGEEPVEGHRHHRGLSRTLTTWATGAVTFSTVGVSAGLFSLFGFSLLWAGPAMFWGWPLVCIGVLFMCLVWSELSSHYPFAGAMYHWPTIISNRH